ncbi:hypothetical protein H4Q26_017298 [Puccinia striiformis f. sp. tritici PST-130]|nr:hypothetical protein H4Q26_017298 [Puccinia striiformis f. sp. tritici PST-130]
MPYAESTLPSDENEDISHILFEKESSVEKEGLSQQDFSSEEEELVENVKISDNQTKIINSSISQIDLDSHSKRFACTQTSNSIDRRSKSDSAQPSELLLDNQPSRNNDANCVPLQTSLTKSSSNRNLKSYLIGRITLPSQGKVFTYTYEVRSSTDEFTYDSTTLTKKRNHIITQKVHSEHLPTVYYQR